MLLGSKLTLALLLVLADVCPQVADQSQSGYLAGSMGFVDADARKSLGDAGGVTVGLEHKGGIIKLLSDEQGDYIVSLAKGKYCLKSAVTAENRALNFSPHQHRCFNIKRGKDTRFDVMLLKP